LVSGMVSSMVSGKKLTTFIGRKLGHKQVTSAWFQRLSNTLVVETCLHMVKLSDCTIFVSVAIFFYPTD